MSESNDPNSSSTMGTHGETGAGITLSSVAGACDEPDCMATLRELDVFLDGELSSDAQSSIRHHLDDCPDCNHAFDFHAELKSVIQRKCLDEVMPAGLLSRIEQCFDTDLGMDVESDGIDR